VFTARYALSPYRKQIRLVFKGLNSLSNTASVFPLCFLEIYFDFIFPCKPISRELIFTLWFSYENGPMCFKLNYSCLYISWIYVLFDWNILKKYYLKSNKYKSRRFISFYCLFYIKLIFRYLQCFAAIALPTILYIHVTIEGLMTSI
jgi:hypothetical protein